MSIVDDLRKEIQTRFDACARNNMARPKLTISFSNRGYAEFTSALLADYAWQEFAEEITPKEFHGGRLSINHNEPNLYRVFE